MKRVDNPSTIAIPLHVLVADSLDEMIVSVEVTSGYTKR